MRGTPPVCLSINGCAPPERAATFTPERATVALLPTFTAIPIPTGTLIFPPHRSSYLYLVMAVFIVLMGALIVLSKGFKAPLYRTLREQVVDRGTASMLSLGFLIGILPCAPLVAILTYIACVATNVLYGIIYALSFGVGTVVPLIILGPLVGFFPERVLKSTTPLRIFRAICGAILILFGLQLLYSVWQLF